METLGSRLKSLRMSLNLTAVVVKKKTGIDDLGRFEKDERKPSIDTLLALAKFYNVYTDWLLTGEGEIYKGSSPQQPAKNSVLARAVPMGEPLTDEQKELLSYFDKMNDISKGRLLEKAEVLAGVQEKEVGRITPKDTEASKELFFSHSDEVLAVNKDDLLKSKRQPEEILH